MLERIATLEEKVRSIHEQLAHLDTCLDSVKRTIWQATGALAVVVFVLEFWFRK